MYQRSLICAILHPSACDQCYVVSLQVYARLYAPNGARQWKNPMPITKSCQQNSLIARFMGPTWGPPWSSRPKMGPMLALWTLLSGIPWLSKLVCHLISHITSIKMGNIVKTDVIRHNLRIEAKRFVVCSTSPPTTLMILIGSGITIRAGTP